MDNNITKLVRQIIEFYINNKQKSPSIDDLILTDEDKKLLEEKTGLFVTLYKSGEIIGSNGSVKESEKNTILELIVNTIGALEDKRFDNKLNKDDLEKIKIRVDLIEAKNQLKGKDSITKINYTKSGVIAIKPDYSKIALILPNISKNINSGKDFIPLLSKKLNEKYKEKDYVNYELITKCFTDF
ncbi:MAG: AMMECR1 domain-containing protein [Candidatus Gracilibacteria bacterium]|nr:AMMECR1 domain-containing protein [Candidatus Gracilibacteria bacterium]